MEHVVKCLQPILLAAWRDAGPTAAGTYHLRELGEHGSVFVEYTGRLHHVDIRANGATRHREANHAGVSRGGHRVELVLTQTFIQQRLNFVHLHVVDVEAVTGAFEGVSHRADVWLRGAGSQRSYG